VIKKQTSIVFSVEPTEYGWSVKEGASQLGLFLTQRHALDDVKRRRTELMTKGRSSTVLVTGQELKSIRGASPHFSRRYR
jgi:hypothetical protein